MKQRQWKVEEKVQILKEVETDGVAVTCRKQGIDPSLYYYWKKQFDLKGMDGLKNKRGNPIDNEVKKLKLENEILKKIIAEKELALEIKEELIKKKIHRQ